MTNLSRLFRPSGIIRCESPAPRPVTFARLILIALAMLAIASPAGLHAQRVTLPTRTAALAASAAADQGVLPDSAPVTLTVRLAPSAARVTALKQRLADQIDPSSPEYHQWLTPQQFAASFGATDDQVAAATAWLKTQALSVASVSAAHTTLTVTGTAAGVESGFAVSLHQMQVAGTAFYANTTQPSLPEEAASLIAGVSGLDNLPASLTLTGSVATDVPGALAAALDANTAPLLTLTGTTCDAAVAQADLDAYTALFQQANAQGVTVIAANSCATGLGAFPGSLGEVTGIALPGATAAENPFLLETRPSWQVAPGLPDDQFRHEPDLTATSLEAFAQAISSIALSSGGRLGNINQTLYNLAPVPGLYTQTDGAPAGTWEFGPGLGLVDLDKLTKVFPRGTGSSFTGIAASTYAPVHGATVTFTATVTSGTGGAIPSGTVTFVTSTGTTLGSGAINASGVATFATNALAGGTTTVTANYGGDTTYATSQSPTAGIFVTPETLVLTATPSTGNIVGGTYTVSVTATGSGVSRPTGNASVTLSGTTTSYSGAWVAGSATTSTATVTVPASIVGTSSLLIGCPGDANFNCNNPYTTTVTVGKATPSLVLNYTPSPAVSGAAIAFTGTLAAVGTAATPTGNVRFFDNGTLINAGALASGKAQATGTDITAATHTITATYDGDANYLTVSATATGTGVTSTSVTSNATTNTGQAFTFTAAITPAAVIGGTLPTGTVLFYDGLTSLGSGTISGTSATLNVASLSTTAAHTITAVYSGDALYAPSTSAAVTIAASTAVSTTTVLSSSTSANTGKSITFSATITPTTVVNSAAPTGTVRFLDGTTVLGSATLTTNAASLPVSSSSASLPRSVNAKASTAGGSLVVPSLATTVAHSITAAYSGDTNYAGSTSTPVALAAVGSTASTTTVSATPTSVASGATVTYTVSVASATSGAAVPTGTVTLTQGATTLGTITLVGGTGSLASTAALPAGSDTVIATYSGDSTYAASTGSTNVTVSATAVVGTLTATVVPAATGPYNTTAAVTATVAVATGSTIPSGATVSASYSGLAGTYTGVVTAGSATIILPVPPPATYNILVSCVATTTFSCSNTVNLPFVATKSASTTSLSINPAFVLGSQIFTLTATVAPSPSTTAFTVPPTGTVTFFNNGAAIGSASVNSSGVATRTTSLAAGGTGVYTATFNGDTNYLTSTTASSTSITATKIAPTIVFFSNGSPTLQGLNVIFTIQVTNYAAQAGTVPTPSGTVTLYDTSSGIPLFIGTATLGSNGVATGIATFSTTGLFAGPHTIYAVYGGDGNYLPITSTIVTVDVSDFRLSFSPGTLQVVRGGSATTTIIATPIDQFNGTISMACAPPADILTTCTITPSTLSGGGQATLTIVTTAPGHAISGGAHAANRSGAWAWRLSTGTMLGMIVFLGIPRARRRKLRSLVVIVLALFAAGITANIGCGNSVSTTGATVVKSGTPLGTAVFTVTAQGQESIGTNRHSYPLQVTITP